MSKFIVQYEPGAIVNCDGIPVKNSDIAENICKELDESSIHDLTFPSGFRVAQEIDGKYVEIFPEIEDLTQARRLIHYRFRQLRKAWFNHKLKQYAHERDWEDGPQKKSREENNEKLEKLFDEQTEALIRGIDVPVAPNCFNDVWMNQ